MPKALAAIAVVLTLALSCNALAEPRCNCSAENDLPDCNPAQVHITLSKDNWIDITVPTDRCTHVDYRIDGEPFEIVVMDGHEREAWLDDPVKTITVDYCKYCLDTLYPIQTEDEESLPNYQLEECRDFEGVWGPQNNKPGYYSEVVCNANGEISLKLRGPYTEYIVIHDIYIDQSVLFCHTKFNIDGYISDQTYQCTVNGDTMRCSGTEVVHTTNGETTTGNYSTLSNRIQ